MPKRASAPTTDCRFGSFAPDTSYSDIFKNPTYRSSAPCVVPSGVWNIKPGGRFTCRIFRQIRGWRQDAKRLESERAGDTHRPRAVAVVRGQLDHPHLGGAVTWRTSASSA
eukprot:7959201-Pyramimonas_sp.AAC.2